MSPAGRTLLAVVLTVTATASLRSEPPEPRAKLEHEGPLTCLAFSPDGKFLAAGDKDSAVRLWHVATGKEVRKWQLKRGEVRSLCFSTDSKSLVSHSSDGQVRLWDVASDKEQLPLAKQEMLTTRLVLAPDGRKLASVRTQESIQIYDFIAGQVLHSIETRNAYLHSLAFTPDSKTLAALIAYRSDDLPDVGRLTLHLWDVASGREIRRVPGRLNSSLPELIFAPDGRTLATHWGEVRFWETATGKERRPFLSKVSALAFSPDSRFLAVADKVEHSIHIRDLVTGKEVLVLEEHEAGVAALAFSPDGKTLASGGGDFTVLLWDLAILDKKRQLPALPLGAKAVEACWNDLADTEANKAYQARNVLIQAPKEMVALTEERLVNLLLLDPKQLAQLLADLDSDRFEARQKATEELEKLGTLAEPALKEILDGKPSLEVRRRVEQLLEKLEKRALSPVQLQALRAVEVLEQIGTTEARHVLQQLAKQTPASFLTHEAAAACQRLAPRAAP